MNYAEFCKQVAGIQKLANMPKTAEELGKSPDDDLKNYEWLRLVLDVISPCDAYPWGGGQMRCESCNLVWDRNDPDPPKCQRVV